jgi:hypothetical protein
VFRNFPLNEIHPHAEHAAEAAEAAVKNLNVNVNVNVNYKRRSIPK